MFGPNDIFGIGEASHFKFGVLTDDEEYKCPHDRKYPRRKCVNDHVTSLNAGK